MSQATRYLYNLSREETPIHTKSTRSRQARDNQDEGNLLQILHSFNLFCPESNDVLQNIATKDLTTEEIQDHLLHAQDRGQKQLTRFVEERLVPCVTREISYRDPLPKNKPLTFCSLYEVDTKGKKGSTEKVLKADRSILQRLIIAYEAGRKVDLNQILQHELLPVPIALAEMNGDLLTASKALLAEALTENIKCLTDLPAGDLKDGATLMIDGMAF